MPNYLVWIVLLFSVLFLLSGITTLYAQWMHETRLRRMGLYALVGLGPATLGLCWVAQMQLMHHQTLLWARLMAGDTSDLWSLGSVGLIIGAGLALGALSLQRRVPGLGPGAVVFALIWIVVYLHPKPHDVPLPDWLDRLIWLLLLAGGAGLCLLIHTRYQHRLERFKSWVVHGAGIVSLLATAYPMSLVHAAGSLDLSSLDAQARVRAPGCLACHSLNGEGYPDPGGPLESAASRKEDTIRAFLAAPTAENAQRFGLRDHPTGRMAGVHLNATQVDQLTKALQSLITLQPPSQLGPGWARAEQILNEKHCLACHTVNHRGAPQGIGGPLEHAADHSEVTLVTWLENPTAETAKRLNLRQNPTGAMATLALPEPQAQEMARWLKSLPPPQEDEDHD